MKFTSIVAIAFVALVGQVTASPVQVKPQAGTAIPNQYIVVLKKHLSKQEINAHESWLLNVVASTAPLTMQDQQDQDSVPIISSSFPGFGILRRYFMKEFKGYSARIPDVLAKALQRLPEVAYVEQDQIMTILDTQTAPPSWGLKRIGSRTLPLPADYTFPDSAGEGVDAYIVDTGVLIGHPDLKGKAKIGASFSTDNHDKDGNGHGTHVAGTVAGKKYGVAKKAQIIAVKVLNSQGSGSNSDVIAGINWVGENAPKTGRKSVANMSLGGGASRVLDEAVRAAIKAGVMFAVAAGNSAGDACKLSPARVKEALTVAASDKNDRLASFSEKGPCVDIIAPGVDITSSWNNGRENTISGTSMASPHACGVLALALGEKDFATPAELKAFVVAIGTRKKVSGVPSNTPNILLYADVTAEPNPEDPPEKPSPPEDPEDPEDPEEGVCPIPQCLFDPSCTGCCIEGIDC
ncbi:hypothetical protein HDV05_003677 [Chytridiales sp. JEL 0842]|nr:hypothetical protein HDV05_003677 [Chytridiales sp. JEL 0842]